MLDGFFLLASDPQATSQVRGGAGRRPDLLAQGLSGFPLGGSVEDRAHVGRAIREIERSFTRGEGPELRVGVFQI